VISANQCLENAANELDGIDYTKQEDSEITHRVKVSTAWQTLAKTINREQGPEEGK
jgi:hypothetical protein